MNSDIRTATMMIHSLLKPVVLSVALMAGTVSALESYPVPGKPIVIVVPFAAGTGTDVITRVVVEKMAARMKATILVDNKAGASGQIGSEFVARAQPDGHTLLVATNSTHSANPYLYKSLRYDPAKDFAPVGRLTINPLALLVKPDSPFRTTQDLIRFAKANPGKLAYGYGNTGGQVSAAMLVNMGNMKTLAVPYKTTPQVFTDLIGGQLDFAFVDFAASRSFIESGKLKALAMTGQKRFSMAPNIPAVSETLGFEEFSLFAWLGLMAPAGTPKPVIARLNAELRAALDQRDVKQRLEQQMGSVVEPTTVDEFNTFLQEQSKTWKRRIADAAIAPE
jgi:tripartite-type tricarboxylate transporter receptor subunit TctC